MELTAPLDEIEQGIQGYLSEQLWLKMSSNAAKEGFKLWVQNYTHTSCLYITFFFRSLNKSRAT
jgi:hypothetical protein